MHYCMYDCQTVYCTSFPFSTLCKSIIITLAPEIIIPPSSETVYSGDTAEFTCHARNAHSIVWRLNGMIVSDYNAINPLHKAVGVYSNGTSGINATLTIKARLESHGLVIHCEVVRFEGGTVADSENATLMVQGTAELRLVGRVANMYTDLIHPLPVQVCWIQ